MKYRTSDQAVGNFWAASHNPSHASYHIAWTIAAVFSNIISIYVAFTGIYWNMAALVKKGTPDIDYEKICKEVVLHWNVLRKLWTATIEMLTVFHWLCNCVLRIRQWRWVFSSKIPTHIPDWVMGRCRFHLDSDRSYNRVYGKDCSAMCIQLGRCKSHSKQLKFKHTHTVKYSYTKCIMTSFMLHANGS